MKKSVHNRNKFLFFRRLLISNIIVFLIPVFVSFFSYQQSLKIITEDSIRFNLSLLKQSRDIIDRQLEKTDSIIKMLESNSYVKSLVNVDQSLRGSRDVYKVWSAYNYLRSAISIENDFANYFVFYKANDVVLSNIYTAVSPLY